MLCFEQVKRKHAAMSIVAIDVHPQRAFSEMCPDEVPVADALSIVPHLNLQASWADFRVLTKDAHVPDAGWIVPQQSDHLPLEQAENWVSHAIVGTEGFETLPNLPNAVDYQFLVHIGLEQGAHPFGACFHDMAENISTGLIEWLKQKEAKIILIGGLITEYCVQATVLQLCWYGPWRVIVNLEACRTLDSVQEQQAVLSMQQAGALVVACTEEIEALIGNVQQQDYAFTI